MFLEGDIFYPVESGIEIYIKVTPGASRNKIGKAFINDKGINVLKVYVTQVAEKGLANEAVIELLCDHFHLHKKQLVLQSGKTSRDKLFLIKTSF